MYLVVRRAQLYAFALGVLSAATVALVAFCLRSNSSLWPPAGTPESTPLITAIDSLNSSALLPNASNIPHIFHQSWVNRTVPKHYSAWRQSWVTNHRHWEFKLWTDEDNDALVRQYAPWFLSRYQEYDEPVMRADSVRYLYLYR